jgi:tRNA-dihydrouridine synthase B
MLRIGTYALSANVVLAPMAGVTDRPFRILARRLGAGLAASEMLTSDQRLWHTAKSRRRMDHSGEPSPRVVQLAGADPAQLAEAARINVDLGAEIIDINMGCPAKKVCSRLCGSALLRDELLVRQLLEAAVRAVPSGVPVTLKTRTGWDREHRNGIAIARIAEQSGIAALAIHGRTRADFYAGEAEYETIAAIKDAVRIPVFANGDISTPEQARAVLRQTAADGIMVGRGAHGAPWIFADMQYFLLHGRSAPARPRRELRDIMLAHLEAIYAFYGEEPGVRIARKHLGWYLRNLPPGPTMTPALRPALMAAPSTAVQFAMVRAALDGWAEMEARAA